MSFACCLRVGQVLSSVLSGLHNNNNMQLPIDFSTLTHAINKLPQVQVARAVSAVILVYIAYILAQITWQVLGDNEYQHSVIAMENVENSTGQKSLNIENLLALNLFGKPNDKAVEEELKIEDVPETKLKLVLAGVVASSNRDAAAAVIEHNGSQETYGIGDKITGTRARLHQVHSDRVIIEQSGRKETLMLDGFDYKKPTARKFSPISPVNGNRKSGPRNTKVVDKRSNLNLASQAKNLKKDIIENPSNIASYLRISPKRVDNKIAGFHLKPGRDGEFFKASGLKNGDVAIQMNGLDLTDTSQVQQALELLKVEQEISLLVDRNGELTEILFSIENEL